MTKLVIIIPLNTERGPTPTKAELGQVERMLRETSEHRQTFLAESFYDIINRLFCYENETYSPRERRFCLKLKI